MIIADGFDEAIIGQVRGEEEDRAVYSYNKMVNILMERDGMEREGAIEYIEYNVLGSYIENGPIYVEEPGEELEEHLEKNLGTVCNRS
jgi:hypothetical protein